MSSRTIFLLLTFFFTSEQLSSQVLYSIHLKDKSNSVYSLDRPEEFLSPRSLARRERLNIPLTHTDLPVSPAYISSVSLLEGVKIINVSRWLNTLIVEVNNKSTVDILAGMKFVAEVREVRKMIPVPPDTLESQRGNVNVEITDDYGYSWKQVSMMNVHKMHARGLDGTGTLIAVLDAGFPGVNTMIAFQRLRNENRLKGYYDFVDNDTVLTNDQSIHGTVVLSCMAGWIPGSYMGTAPGAEYWLLRTEDAASETIAEEYNWVEGAEFADSIGADVINSSLGYTTFDDSLTDHTYQDLDGNTTPVTIAADIAVSKGILVVNSAGNAGGSSWQYIGAPADGDSVLAAGGVDENGEYAFFSSTGPTADGRIKPDLSAMAYRTWLVFPDNTIAQGNGTSFSSPLIAGAAATLIQEFPSLHPVTIVDEMKRCASQHNNPDTLLGYGIPDLYCTYLNLGGTDFPDDNLVSVYPNPFSEELYIRFFTAEQEEIIIRFYDVSGKKIHEVFLNVTPDLNIEIRLSDIDILPRGAYIFEVSTNENSYYKKIVKY